MAWPSLTGGKAAGSNPVSQILQWVVIERRRTVWVRKLSFLYVLKKGKRKMGIIENAKEAVKLVQQIGNIDLYRRILDLRGEAIELTEELKKKDEIIAQLKDALDLKGKFIYKDSAYYITDENDKIIDGPFCTKCFDVDHIKCRLVPENIGPQVICPNCRVSFASKPLYSYLRPDVEADSKAFLEKVRNLNARRGF